MARFRVEGAKIEMAVTAAETAVAQARGWRSIAEYADTDPGEAAEMKADALDLANLANEHLEAAYAGLKEAEAMGLKGVEEEFRKMLADRADRLHGRLEGIWERVAAETGQAGGERR